MFLNRNKMHRVTFLANLKKTKSWILGLTPSSLYHADLSWFHNSSPARTENGEIKTTAWTSHFSCLPTKELALGYKPPIAKRSYLPGSETGGFPEFLPGPKEASSFPMAYKVQKPEQFDIKDWSNVCRELIDAELTVYGAILIRYDTLFGVLQLICVNPYLTSFVRSFVIFRKVGEM